MKVNSDERNVNVLRIVNCPFLLPSFPDIENSNQKELSNSILRIRAIIEGVGHLAFIAANLDSIPSIPHGPLNTKGCLKEQTNKQKTKNS